MEVILDDTGVNQVGFVILYCWKLERLCCSGDGHRRSWMRNTTDSWKRGMRWKRPINRDRYWRKCITLAGESER
jgi:hypothetical protein